MKAATYAPVYAALYPALAEAVRGHGYALAVHGTLGRDMDLICVPWGDEPAPPQQVVDALTDGFALEQIGAPEIKLHGRMAYTLGLAFGECFIDLSFTPRQQAWC